MAIQWIGGLGAKKFEVSGEATRADIDILFENF